MGICHIEKSTQCKPLLQIFQCLAPKNKEILLHHYNIIRLRTFTISTILSNLHSHSKFSNCSYNTLWAFPSGSVGKESACSAGDPRSFLGSGRAPRGGHSNPLQCSCLEKPMDRGAWQATSHSVAKSQTWLKWLSMHAQWSLPEWDYHSSKKRHEMTEISMQVEDGHPNMRKKTPIRK